MKVALLRPNYKTHLITPPLGLGYISSYLKSRGRAVKFLDGLNLGLDNDALVREAADCEVAGITCLSGFYHETVDLARKLKAAGKTVVLGGVHPSVLPEASLAESGADFVVVGEGELTFDELLTALEKGEKPDLPGVWYPGIKHFVPRAQITDLDSLPFPDWEAMDPREYQKAPHGALIKNFPVAPVITTRGCPYACKFCASPSFWGKRFRLRSPAKVVEEVEYLVRNFGVKEIHFEDDNLTLRRDHVKAICELLIEKKLNVSWATPNGIRADRVDEEILALMKKAGCYYVVFGIESGNQHILENIKKKETLADIERAVRAAHKLGMLTQGFFIFGLPGETEETIKNSVAFAKKLPLDRAQFLILDLIPGSALWEEHKGSYAHDFRKDSYHEPTWVPPTVTAETLKEWQPRAFREFFFRPGPLFSLIKFFRFSQLKHVLNRLRDFKIFKG